jgi:hypothetical protein
MRGGHKGFFPARGGIIQETLELRMTAFSIFGTDRDQW